MPVSVVFLVAWLSRQDGVAFGIDAVVVQRGPAVSVAVDAACDEREVIAT
jgi:hypothetical protein